MASCAALRVSRPTVELAADEETLLVRPRERWFAFEMLGDREQRSQSYACHRLASQGSMSPLLAEKGNLDSTCLLPPTASLGSQQAVEVFFRLP